MPSPSTDLKKAILLPAAGAAAAALLLWDMCIAIDGKICWTHVLPLFLLVLCSLLIRIRESGTPVRIAQYTASSGEKVIRLKHRNVRLDYLRLLAVTGVITIHAIDALFPFLTTDVTGDHLIVQAGMNPFMMHFDAAVRTCCLGFNVVYIMLSGALLIPWKEEKISDFYLKRFAKVFLPLLIFFFFYEWQNHSLYPLTLDNVGNIFVRFFTAETENCPFYWLIYIILSLYLIYPFMRYMMKDLPYKALCLMCLGILIFSGTTAYTSFVFAPVIGGWLGFAILGYWVTRPETRRYDPFLLLMGIVQAAVIWILIGQAQSYSGYIGKIVQYTPIMIFLTLGYFAFVYLLPSKWLRDTGWLRFFGKYSFSVILVHWWVLYFILGRYYGGRANLFTRLYQFVLSALGMHASLVFLIIADLLLSLLVGMLLENYFLKAPLWVFDRLTERLKNRLPF